MAFAFPFDVSTRRAVPPTLVFLAFTVVAFASPPADAQSRARRQAVEMGSASADPGPAVAQPPARMVPLQATMSQAWPEIFVNADGSDLWPCYGRTTGNADCPTVGVPVMPLPHGAFVTGVPASTWALKNDDVFGNGLSSGTGCDAFVNGSTGVAPGAYKACGQIATFFEDDTNDANDDLLQRVIVTQGTNVIYDSGVVDFGPAGPAVHYPVDVELYYDVNFGFWPGSKAGPDNGNCSPDIAYPLAAPAFPGVIYQIAAGSTCRRPQAGKARVHTQTLLGTPSYRQVTGDRCTRHGVASPCYTVAWEQKYQIEQDWDIFLR